MAFLRRRVLENYASAGGKDVIGEWLDDLRDVRGRSVIQRRLERVEDGNFGDHAYVGGGVWELRIHYGPGYRVYYAEHGSVIVLLLCAGDKSTQHKDIRRAQEYWEDYRRTSK